MPLSRRELMRRAAVLGSVAPVAATLGVQGARADTPPPSPSPSPSPTFTSSDFFSLSSVTTSSFQTTGALHGLKAPQTHFQVQGMAINSATNKFFIAQAPNPDPLSLKMTLDGTTWSADPYSQLASGDLIVARFDLMTQTFRDSMYFMGAGHGGQIGIEPTATRAYLWAEVYPGTPRLTGVPPHTKSSQVWGRNVARLPYAAGRLMTNTQVVLGQTAQATYAVQRFSPVRGAHEYNASIDTSSAYPGSTRGVRVVRYRLGGDPSGSPRRFTAFDLAAAANGDFSAPLASTTEPIEISQIGGHTEGYASCGQYIYLTATFPTGTSYLYEVDFNAAPGSYVAKIELPGTGEPESVALYAPNGVPSRLYYLSAPHVHPRTFDLFYLDTTA
ncbi:MAG: hypothetical protein ACTHK4_00880 [Mycobacteriales bacterium]